MAKLIEKELKEIARIIIGIKRHIEEHDVTVDKQLEKINKIFELFNKKYPKISLKISKKFDFSIGIYLHEQSVRKVFDDAAKIKGMTAIGTKSFDEVTIQDSDKFAAAVEKIKDTVFLTYSLDIGVETIILRYNEKDKNVQLLYELKSISNKLTPQYQLLDKYASKETHPEIDLLSLCYELGFMDIEDTALQEWEDEFWPKMLE